MLGSLGCRFVPSLGERRQKRTKMTSTSTRQAIPTIRPTAMPVFTSPLLPELLVLAQVVVELYWQAPYAELP